MDKMTVTARLLALLPHKQDSDLQLIFLLLPPKDMSYVWWIGKYSSLFRSVVEFKWISRRWRVFYPVL